MNNNPTTLSRILNGINTSLNIANKVMPIYKEAKPIITTVGNTYKNLKNNKNDLTNIIKIIKANNTIKKKFNNTTNINIKRTKLNKTYSNNNNPTFFI